MKKCFVLIVSIFLIFVNVIPVNAEAGLENIYNSEIEKSIISGSGTDDDPYILDYSKAPNFKKYVDNSYESLKSKARASGFTGYSLTQYKGQYSSSAVWMYSSGGMSVSSDGNLRIVKVAYVPNSKLGQLYVLRSSPQWVGVANDILSIGNDYSSAISNVVVMSLFNAGITQLGGYSAAVIGSAVASALGASTALLGTVLLVNAISTSPISSAMANAQNYASIHYYSAYHGSWYSNTVGEAGWTGNKIYIPASYLGAGTFRTI